MSEAKPLLAFEHVDTYYGQIHILNDVSLQVGAGELVCLLGGNASGKSTTLKTALGIVRPREGRVVFDGEDLAEHNTSYRIGRGMAIVPENRRLFAPMSVLENLEMGAYLHGGGAQGGLRARLHALPAPARAPQAAGGHALGRRAADGRDGARADVAAEAAADGRAVDGARADPRRAQLRDHPAGARVGRRDPGRRAERQRLALDRRPRLRPADRPRRPVRARRPTCSSTRICGRPTLAVDVAVAAGPDPPPLPGLRAAGLHQQLLAGRALGLGARGLRALPRRLGRARRAVGVLGRPPGGGARRRSRGSSTPTRTRSRSRPRSPRA